MKSILITMKKHNKGFSLVEIICAIAILAIVVTPIMNSFITSARINREARSVMAASDCSQAIMEGFSDKSGNKIAKISYSPSTLSNQSALSYINEGVYNDSTSHCQLSNPFGTAYQDTYYSWTDDQFYSLACSFGQTVVGQWDSGAVNRTDQVLFKAGTKCTNNSDDGTGNNLLPDADMASCGIFCYTNIKWENKKYDAIVICVPVAKTANDKFYSYRLKMFLFDDDNFADTVKGLVSTKYIIDFDGGVKGR